MRGAKNILTHCVICMVLLCGLTLTASATTSGTCGDNLTWVFDSDSGILTISGTGEMTDYSIGNRNPPWYINYRYDIQKVIIESGVTSIGKSAFYGCTELTTVSIPSTVNTIGGLAFYESGITSVTIPSGVTSIATQTFYNCFDLVTVSLPSGLTSIGSEAFYRCGFSSISIPSTVTSIGEDAFYKCEALTAVTIPSGVTSIGAGAFSYCTALTGLTVASGNSNYCAEDGILFSKDMTLLHTYPATKGTTYTIPSSVTTIGSDAFAGCSSLSAVTIPSSVTYIGRAAFSGCAITTITIPSSVNFLGDYAFYSCTRLTEATLPSGLVTIETGTFNLCGNLTTLTIPSSVCEIKWGAFYSCNKITDVYYGGTYAMWKSIEVASYGAEIRDAAYMHYQSAEADATTTTTTTDTTTDTTGTTSGTSYGTCGDNLTWIFDGSSGSLLISGTGAMVSYENTDEYPWHSYRAEIQSITVSSGVTSIGALAFGYCDALTAVSIPDTVTQIESFAFYHCTTLPALSLPSGITSIPAGLCYECYALTSVSIPDSVTSIELAAFADCQTLPSVTIPSAVTSFGDNIFYGCTALSDIYYTGTMAEWDSVCTTNLSSYLEGVTIHYGAGDMAQHPFTDVETGSYYEAAVVWAVNNGVTTGATDTTFDPDGTCTRAQVVTFLWRASGEPTPSTMEHPFTDVSSDAYYYLPVLWAVEQGITTGTSDTAFSPDDTCTSGQVLTFLYRANGQPGATGNGAYYTDAVNWASYSSIASDVTPDALSPRSDIVTYLYRYAGSPDV